MSRSGVSLCLGCVLCLFILGLTACHGGLSTQPEIRIGLITYLRGDKVEMSGQPTVNAAQFAIQGVNESGGLEVGARKYQVVLVVEEIDDTPEEAVAAAQKLINQENVVVIVGPQFSGDAIPAGEVAEIGRIPMICPIATNPQVTAGRQYVFRMSFVDDFQGGVMARFARHRLGAQTAAVLYDVANAYNRGIAEFFKEVFETLGGQVVASETYTTGERDFTPQLERIKQQEPEVLFLPNYSNDALLQAQQARQIGVGAILLGSDGWDQRSLPGLPEFEGAFMSAHWSVDIQDERTQTFVSTYWQTFNQEPNDTAALTYDAFGILFDVLKSQVQVDPQLIRDGLYNLDPYRGVSGTIDFQDSGDPLKGAVILQFKDGQDVFYELVLP